MEKGLINSLLVVLMLIAVGGFAILSDNGSNSDSSSDDGENQQMDDEWDVYYVDSGNDLPNCNSDTLGRLYYVASTTTFEVCLTSGWSFIDIKGADGQDGTQGPQGEPGMDGQPANETMMYDLEQQLAKMNQDMAVLLSNISSIDDDLITIDDTIELYYTWFTTINTDVIEIKSNLTMVWNTIIALQSDLANATSCQLAPYAYCAGADLSGMNLSGMDLTGIDLRGANLQNTTFDYATLDGADLRSIIAMNANFIHTGMNETYLQYAEFNRYSTSDCGGWCGEANLTNASLDKADLADADLRYADLTDAYLRYADLTDTILYNADLTDADLYDADLTDAYLYDADLTGADLRYADLTDAYLYDADLTDANLRFADLTDADLYDADLTGAYLYGCRLDRCGPQICRLDQCRFDSICYCNKCQFL